jgi:hypothetical protein
MNDLDVLAAFRPEIAVAGFEELAPSRRRLMAAIASEPVVSSGHEADGPSAPATGAPIRRSRSGRAAALIVVAAAAVTLALIVVPGTTHAGPRSLPSDELTAAVFLHQAASAVERDAVHVPQPNQFVYTETEDSDGTVDRTWLSVDGASPGRVDGAGAGSDEIASCTVAQAEATRCYPAAGFLPGLPTDPSTLLAFLNRIGIIDTVGQANDSLPGWEDNVIGKAVMYLMQTTYLLPAQQAALYDLMAGTPGFQVVADLKDAIGRTGVGIEWSFQGDSGVVIFDPTTYDFLGVRTWPGSPSVGGPYDGSALVAVAVVDRLGERQ